MPIYNVDVYVNKHICSYLVIEAENIDEAQAQATQQIELKAIKIDD